VPLLVRSPEAVIEDVSLMVSVLPVVTVKFPWAKMPEVSNAKAIRVNIFFIGFF